MAFGPDGYLYISVGDGGSADDPLNTGQDPSDWLGSILRIEVDPEVDTRLYDVPEDNPFFQNSQFAPEVWAFGLRNVWRFSFDRATGDMYLGDVGQNQWEEVNFVPAGSPGGVNFGWRSYEGEMRYLSPEPLSEVTFPFAVYSHSGGSCSVTGGYVYRGEAIPDLQGVYLFSDYCSGRLWASYRTPDGTWQTVDLPGTNRRISSFGEDDSGELYLVDYNGVVLRFSAPGQ
jgi:glucose/arabinose dehydrogenase